ncbi:glutamate-1-semialdehyde 2,1-aminomutase [Methylacidiphilum caldifontis]|uniref:Glutamate-1-semialdehyde 2,1-aminomutase n=1 Tax=Methylacidiphilum caldifontis TaxID=2795386 RepID=A0A4Y8PA29_9BACT|nr:glutamate-1-semialdehyde 2,1-aminomutase [Methylacidiphilum caldifontis]TFE67687.1 glutamate-1-semialdehyde-2,1-aminomutase [Methylacidiphilum caldifontis]
MVFSLSEKLWAEAQQLFPGGVNSPVRSFKSVGGIPFYVSRAKGSKLFDVDGNSYTDYVCSWGALIHGHAHPAVVRSIGETLQDGTSFGANSPLEIKLAQLIRSAMPSIEKIRFVNSGTEACMSAIRIARGFSGREKIIKFEGCYHGHSDSLLVKAGSGALTTGVPDSSGVPSCLSSLTVVLPWNDKPTLLEAFKKYGKETAAVILEPIPANCGLIPPTEGFLECLLSTAKQYGTLVIFDEVITGFRLAMGGAQELFGIQPDLTVLGKIIGGGLPVGAVGGKKEIMDCLSPVGTVYQAGTLSGNPLAMAAGIAQLEQIKKLPTYSQLETLGRQLEAAIEDIQKKLSIPLQFHRFGSMFSFFFTPKKVLSSADAYGVDKKRFSHFFTSLLHSGIFLPPSPYETAFLSTAHSESDIDELAKIVYDTLKKIT